MDSYADARQRKALNKDLCNVQKYVDKRKI